MKLDSSAITNDGKFRISGKATDGGGFYRLNIGGLPPEILLIEGGETLLVETDAKAAGKAATKVTGSPNMEYFQRLKYHQYRIQGQGR